MRRKEKDNSGRRMVIISVIMAAVMVLYGVRLFDWQIANNSEYKNKALSGVETITSVAAARGEIYDRYGRELVINQDSYNVVFNRIYLKDANLNSTIITLSSLLGEKGEAWIDNCPLTAQAPYEFVEDGAIAPSAMITELKLGHYATAENCWNEMVTQFGLESFSDDVKRLVMGVRLTMIVADYCDTIPYTFAKGVSLDTVTRIKENSVSLPGVETEVATTREYADSSITPHILGNIGQIYAEEWSDLKTKGYTYSDYIGKAGIEKACEDELRGTSGERTYTRDSSGNVISSEISTQPQAGNSVMLTLDRNLQQVAQNSLANLIAARRNTKGSEYANAGAIVVIKVNTGEILAAVTYPNYDIQTFQTNYQSLLKDPAKPLFNRAFSGTYAPGSTFKPATASIGLQTGAITSGETIYCKHTYTYYEDYQPSCMHYHGSLNVSQAIQVSCNYFFYETGRRIGITKLNEFCKKFGLGVKTGLELDEATGILAGREYRESIGSYWTDGDTLQAAIGQSDNCFTPLQLATYTSTIANGGTRYKSHLIKEICNYSLDTVVDEKTPEIADTTGISADVFDVVKKGMLSVTTDGTASALFSNYDIQVGGKTGTATVYDGGVEYNNGVFIAFAPYDNPEIAVVTIVEKGGYGSGCTQPAKDIFDAYFFYQGETYTGQNTGVLVN